MSIKLPSMEGYQPQVTKASTPKNLETKGYQPQQTVSVSAPPKKTPPKKP